MTLNNKVCIITGASSGIGKATAIEVCNRRLYETVVLIGRDELKLNETYRTVNKTGVNVDCIVFDLSYLEQIPQLVDNIYQKHGRIDALLNIAGYTEPASLLNTTISNFEYTYRVNVFSVFVLIKECVKHMKQSGGKILNVASTAGISARPGWLSYSTSKAAIISLSQTLSAELAEYKILVYCVSPGRCATDLRKILAPDEDPETIMQPNEVATIICNLINSEEMCLDGQNIIIRKQPFL